MQGELSQLYCSHRAVGKASYKVRTVRVDIALTDEKEKYQQPKFSHGGFEGAAQDL